MRADCWALPVVSRPPLLLFSRVPRAYLLGALSGLCAAGIGGWRFCSRASPRRLMHALILVAYTNKYGVFTELYRGVDPSQPLTAVNDYMLCVCLSTPRGHSDSVSDGGRLQP